MKKWASPRSGKLYEGKACVTPDIFFTGLKDYEIQNSVKQSATKRVTKLATLTVGEKDTIYKRNRLAKIPIYVCSQCLFVYSVIFHMCNAENEYPKAFFQVLLQSLTPEHIQFFSDNLHKDGSGFCM